MARRTANQAGFTLIESMLAMMVFVVGALGLLSMIYTSHKGVSAASRITQATALTRSKLDELLRLAFDDALLADGAHDDGTKNIDDTGAITTSDFGADDGTYARSWTVTIPDAGVDFKIIQVRVRWWDNQQTPAAWVDVELRGGKGP